MPGVAITEDDWNNWDYGDYGIDREYGHDGVDGNHCHDGDDRNYWICVSSL